MEKPNAATSPIGATPANVAPVKTQPSSSQAPASNTGAAGNEEGKVTITTKEYGELQRAKARSLSFDRRAALPKNQPTVTRPANASGEANEAIDAATARADAAERRALQSEVKDHVRDLLSKPEYAKLPASTKDLILKNPQMLSTADNLEEALLDIEDFLIEQADQIGDGIPVVIKDGNGTRPIASSNHEIPPTSAGGAATPTGDEVEDTSKLTGSARTRAMIRNSARKARSGQ